MTLGDRIAVLREGRLQQYAPPLELYRRPANRFVAGFIGNPPMNLVPGRIRGEGGAAVFSSGFGNFGLPESVIPSAPSGEWEGVVFGLRPQHVSVDGAIPAAAGTPTIRDCTIRHVEPLGESVNIHVVALDGGAWIAKGAADFAPREGKVDLRLDLSHAHLFAADEQGPRLN
jgi:ABC-type sugar transport system ATPase subunit